MSKYPKDLMQELRRQGFKREGREITSSGTVIYQKPAGDRVINLQLWNDGNHRVSHFLNGCMSTYPTDFTDLAGMKRAIKRELTRKDHKP